MCGRYSLATPDPTALRTRFGLGESVEVRRRYNVAPTDEVLAVTTDREGVPRGETLRWGLVPGWADSPRIGARLINARAETAEDKPAFRGAFARMRCLICADGFYEWRRPDDGGPKTPFWITREDGAPFAFAGLWSVWHGRGDDADRTLRTCTILTTAANDAIAPLHDRMPVILAREHESAWLDITTPRPVLDDVLAGLSARATAVTEVGTAVNDACHDAADCLAPPAEPAQGALF